MSRAGTLVPANCLNCMLLRASRRRRVDGYSTILQARDFVLALASHWRLLVRQGSSELECHQTPGKARLPYVSSVRLHQQVLALEDYYIRTQNTDEGRRGLRACTDACIKIESSSYRSTIRCLHHGSTLRRLLRVYLPLLFL